MNAYPRAPTALDVPTIGLWACGIALAAALGVASVEAPLALVALLAAIAAIVVLLLAFLQPGWVLVVQVVLLASYSVYVLQGRGGVTTSPETLLFPLIVSLGVSRLFRTHHLALPLRELGLLAALLVAMLISMPFAVDQSRSVADALSFVRNAALVVLMLVLLDRPLWLRRAMWAFVIGAAWLASVALLQQLLGSYDNSYLGFASVNVDRGLTRSAGPLNPNFLAEMLVSASVLALYLGLASTRRSVRLVGFALSAACVGGIWFTYSRASLLVVALVLLGVAFLRRVRLRVILAVTAAVAVAAFALPTRSTIESSFGRLVESLSPHTSSVQGDVSAEGRASEALAAIAMFREHPILGVGAGNYPARYLEYSEAIGLDPRAEERSPHNIYLQALAQLGTVGAGLFFGLLWIGLRGAWRARTRIPGRDGLLAEATFVALLGFMVNGLFLHLSYDVYFWLVLGLALVAGRVGLRTPDEPGATAPRR